MLKRLERGRNLDGRLVTELEEAELVLRLRQRQKPRPKPRLLLQCRLNSRGSNEE